MAAVMQAQRFGDIHQEGTSNQLVINQVIQIAVAEIKTRLFVAASPYVGLARFEERHKDVFFGRDALVAKLLNLVSKRSLVLVTGASGSGKSSVVRSGLLPQLASRLSRARYRPCVLTPDQDPFLSLRSTLIASGFSQAETAKLRSDADTPLAEALEELRPRGELWTLFVDQFEEVFTLCSDSRTRKRFLDGLVALGNVTPGELSVVLAIRADFLDRLGAHPEFAELAESGLCLVTDMQASELRTAIEQPAAKHGVVFEKGLVEQIIADVKGRPGALPLLQYTLDLLWHEDHPEDHRTINTVNYHKLGGVEGALRRRADALFRFSDKAGRTPRPEAEQEAMRRIFLRLVDLTNQGTDGRTVSKRAQLGEFEKEEENRLIAELVDEKLLVSNAVVGTNPNPGSSTVELAHEALLSAWPLLKQWIDQAREVLYVRNRLSADARRWSEVKITDPSSSDEELWGGTRLSQAQELRARGDFRTVLDGLSVEEETFLDVSLLLRTRRTQEGAKRLQRARIAAVVLGVAFLVAALGWAQVYRKSIESADNRDKAAQSATEAEQKSKEAKQKSQEAQDSRLIAVAQSVQEDPTTAVTVLREVQRKSSDADSTLWIQASVEALRAGVSEVVFQGHDSGVTAIAFKPDGKKIASGSWDDTVCVWDADGAGSPRVLKGHKDHVTSVAFSPDGKKIASGSWDATVRIWSAEVSDAPRVLQGHKDHVTSVAFSPDGKKIASGSRDDTVRIWNADGNGTTRVFKVNLLTFVEPSGAIDSPSGARRGKGAGFWPKTEQDIERQIDGHLRVISLDHISSVAFSPDGQRIAIGSQDEPVWIWRPDGTPLILEGHEHHPHGLAIKPRSDEVNSVAFSPDGKKIASGSSDKAVRVWNADGSGTLLELTGHGDKVNSVAFSPDGKKIASGSDDKTVRLWIADDTANPQILKGHTSNVTSVAFSPDGKMIASGSSDHTVRVWNIDGSARPRFLKDDISSIAPGTLLDALWSATTYCLPENRRQELLRESPEDAKQGYGRCRKEVARRRGWPLPAP